VFGSSKAAGAAKSPSLVVESMSAITGVLGDFNDAMDGVNNDLVRFNRKNELKRERTENERAEERRLRLQRIEWEVRLSYAKTEEEKVSARSQLAALNAQLVAVRAAMADIEKHCEIDAIEEQCIKLGKT
jgi:hypothetical protein